MIELEPGAEPPAKTDLIGDVRRQIDACRAAAPAGLPLIPGYRVIDVLGRGGVGIVYRAEQRGTRRIVALKLMRPELLTPHRRSRMEVEAECLGRLEHKGIARIYEAGIVQTDLGEQPYLAMELIRGARFITTWCRAGKLATGPCLELLARVCDAVHAAHQKGVIHRDLKPANVVVDGDGHPKVLDLGAALAADSGVDMASVVDEGGGPVGTIAYMSPEQIGGAGGQLDVRSDVYALGLIGYEMLAGRLPYAVRSAPVHEAARIIREEEPARLGDLERAWRGDVETIIGKALEKDAARRYQSAAGLAEDIRRFLADEPIRARPPSAPYMIGKYLKRRKGTVAVAMAVVMLLVAAVLVALASARAADRREEARRLMSVVSSLFRTAAPDRAGHDVALLDAVRRNQWIIDEQLEDFPAMRGALYGQLADMFYLTGAWADAEPLYRSALPLIEATEGAGSRKAIRARHTLLNVLRENGRLAEAEALARRSIPLARGAGNEKMVLKFRYNLAEVLHDLGRLEEAETMYRLVMASQSERIECVPYDLVDTMGSLGMALVDRGERLDEAEALIRGSLGRRDSADALSQVRGRCYLGAVLLARERPHEAREELTAALDLAELTLNPHHPDALRVVHALGQAHMALDDPAAAEPLLRRASDGAAATLSEGHWRIGAYRASLGRCLVRLGRADAADIALREGHERLVAALGPEHHWCRRVEGWRGAG